MATSDCLGNRRIAYYYDNIVGNYYYGHGHPMKPHRMRMAHSLILNYGLLRLMEYYKPREATFEEMTVYHSDEYINFLKCVNHQTKHEAIKYSSKFNVGEDCPIFPGIYDFCKLSAGGSISAAIKLNRKESDIVINWSGGLHHAKKSEASGFCYVNDIVLAILELLKYHERVLYIDIDVHHGDGVEEAFYTTDRVMTVSFHKYGEYFPGTGDIKDIGFKNGKYYSLNFPLKDGIDDESYAVVFRPLIERVIQSFRPSAIVLQCGADSLTGDRLGCFNLSINGHAACVEYVKSFNIPLMLLGGGGYTIRNVSRCWAKETSVALGVAIPDSLPYTDYYEYYGPDFKLNIIPTNQPNMNTPEYLDKMMVHLCENLRMIPHAPSIPSIPIPPDAFNYNVSDDICDSRANTDRRISIMEPDMRAHRKNEYFDRDSDDELDPVVTKAPKMIDDDIEFVSAESTPLTLKPSDKNSNNNLKDQHKNEEAIEVDIKVKESQTPLSNYVETKVTHEEVDMEEENEPIIDIKQTADDNNIEEGELATSDDDSSADVKLTNIPSTTTSESLHPQQTSEGHVEVHETVEVEFLDESVPNVPTKDLPNQETLPPSVVDNDVKTTSPEITTTTSIVKADDNDENDPKYKVNID